MVCPPHNIDQLLLDAGLALLPSTGCAGFSVHKLARHAGVNLGMFHCGPLAALRAAEPAFEVRVQRHYHPEGLTSYNVIPGLIGAVLTMTRVVMTAPAMTRERERGTMDNLLSTPARQLEVMLGKIVPYILIGYVQVVVILLAARLLFDLPMIGSLWAAVAGAGGLHCGQSGGRIYFSTIARNQLQAMQLTFFFFLPSMPLTGFMFAFRSIPDWAQAIGEALPLSHFLRIARGIMLKGNGWAELLPISGPSPVHAGGRRRGACQVSADGRLGAA